ncbi:hypothetical protein [Fodinibius salsisoli]|uniref:Uncharacterized protein n=1 Tax=Fodinibius salsisoli TaxID=2820877 RepID=A0ABT3PL90_9BACT|nr:hypothetical protein [Fodinibius salsisoli]MCW9706715.1 hypothetical protein [Fodinibius salsisoli]
MNIFKSLPTNTRTLLVLTLFSTLLVTACSDNPASSDDEHTDPEIIELVHDGEVIYEYSDITGEVTEHSHLHYHVGEEYLFEVHFLNEEGEHVHAEDLGEGYSLGWEIENTDILAIHQHDDNGQWEFHLEGMAEGGSKIQFLLNHGSGEDAHSHLETPATTQDDAIEFHIDADSDGEHEH